MRRYSLRSYASALRYKWRLKVLLVSSCTTHSHPLHDTHTLCTTLTPFARTFLFSHHHSSHSLLHYIHSIICTLQMRCFLYITYLCIFIFLYANIHFSLLQRTTSFDEVRPLLCKRGFSFPWHPLHLRKSFSFSLSSN